MELTTYFSDRQRFIIKNLWIPGIIIVILSLISCFFIDFQMEIPGNARRGVLNASFIFLTLKWAVAFGWEPIANKDYKKALLTIVAFFILNLAFIPFVNKVYHYLPSFIDITFLIIVWSCAQVALVSYIAGKQNWWQIGLVAGLILCYITEVPSNPLNFLHIYGFSLSKLVTDFFLPFMIYGWIYLAENFFNDKDYRNLLNSKIQVLGGKEYRFLYPLLALSCWIIIFQSASLLKSYSTRSAGYYSYSSFLSESFLTNAITFITEVSIFYITANLTRNIVMSRMTTIANNNGWLYMLHYIPVVNIIIWIIFANKPAQHTTKSENAVFYTTKHLSAINNYIIGLGVLFSILDLYSAYQFSRRDSSGATAFIFLIMFVKLVTYFFLDKGKTAVITLVTLGCIGSLALFIAATGTGHPPPPLSMAAVLSYFFLIEIFHPELEKTDNTQLPEAYTA